MAVIISLLSVSVCVFRCWPTLSPQPGVRLCYLTEFYWREWQRSSNRIHLWSSSISTVIRTWWQSHSALNLYILLTLFEGVITKHPVCGCVCRAVRCLWAGLLLSQSLKRWRSTTRSPASVSLTLTWGGFAQGSCWPPSSSSNWTTLALERWHKLYKFNSSKWK